MGLNLVIVYDNWIMRGSMKEKVHMKLYVVWLNDLHVYDNWIMRGSMKEKVHMKPYVVWLNDLHLPWKALDVYIVGL